MKSKIRLINFITSIILIILLFVAGCSRNSDIRITDDKISKIEWKGIYSGKSQEIKQKGITLSIPIHDRDIEEFVVEDDEDSPLEVEGYGYRISINRIKNSYIYENIPLNEELSSIYNGEKTINEYYFSNLYNYESGRNHDYEDVEFLIAHHGNKYSIKENENYINLIVLNDEFSKEEEYYNLFINIYDKSNFALQSIIYIRKSYENKDSYMSIDEVSFIVDSLEISDY